MLHAALARHRHLSALLAALTLLDPGRSQTWFLEARIKTSLRPAAAVDRAVYAVVANVLIDTALAVIVLRVLARRGAMIRENTGFGSSVPLTAKQGIAFLLGFGFYALRRRPAPWLALRSGVRAFVHLLAAGLLVGQLCVSSVASRHQRKKVS